MTEMIGIPTGRWIDGSHDYPLTFRRFVNLDFDPYHTETPGEERVRMKVFTNRIGNATFILSH